MEEPTTGQNAENTDYLLNNPNNSSLGQPLHQRLEDQNGKRNRKTKGDRDPGCLL